MSSYLSMMESRLPPGFRFHPRDEELCDYLAMKIYGDKYGCSAMIDIDLNKCEPWDLPETARVAGKEWYFFSLRDRKYATGQRTNRATLSGYWKATGKDLHVTRTGGVVVGMRKTLVFYLGRAPKGRKTDWVMHEFRLAAAATAGNDDQYSNNHSVKEDWVLCRVSHKNRSAHSSSSPKPDMETTSSSYEDIMSSSSSLSLPPLMDQSHHQTYINFGGQSQLNFEEYEEQVPCFSNTAFQISTSGPPPMASRLPAGTFESSMMPIKSPHSDHTRNKDVIREVLNTITKLEGNPKEDPSMSLGEGSIDSYLCENSSGFLPIW